MGADGNWQLAISNSVGAFCPNYAFGSAFASCAEPCFHADATIFFRAASSLYNHFLMLKILLITALVIVVILVCVLVLAATKPARFAIQRSIVIQAPPERVFVLINDLHRWPEWSADEKDASTYRSYSGAPAGKGAICEWEGTGSAGKGRIEILEASPHLIRLQA